MVTVRRKTQIDHFYDVSRNIGEKDALFMDMIKDGPNSMTNAELKALIRKRPNVYGRYAGFVGKLRN